MTRPRLLDLFACEGGASVGYANAGFDVRAVDLAANRLKRNPYAWLIADAFAVLERYGDQFDAIHASPPCQGYSRGNAGRETEWPKLIGATREALEATGKPYCIENVTDAGWDMVEPVALCGCMFDLSTIDTDGIRIHLKRERLFETNWPLAAPRPTSTRPSTSAAGAYGGARRGRQGAARRRTIRSRRGCTEHDMTWNGLFECLPPAYTAYVGTQLLAHIEGRAAA